MIKLYVKTISLVILLAFFVLSANHFVYSYFTTKDFNHINRVLSKGTLKYLQTILANTPKSHWAEALKQNQPKNTPLAKILPIQTLQLSEQDKQRLLEGKIITTAGEQKHYSYFLYYGIFETYSYQRIGDSQFALAIMLTEPVNQIIKSTMHWITHIITMQLEKTPISQWPFTLKKLRKIFGVPLHLVSKSDPEITNKMLQDLKVYSVAFSYPNVGDSIKTLYFKTPTPNKILVIGPIKYSQLSELFSVEQNYYFIILSIASILIVIFLTWLFSRNVLKLYQNTKRFSVGDFSPSTKVSKFSVLHGIYENVASMGNNLKYLIQSKQNMTRFVAHEVRTPLSTIQLAIDSLRKDQKLSKETLTKIDSIQEDVEDINKLISYFLLYQKTSSHEIKPKREKIDVSSWLKNTMEKYKLTETNISLLLPTKGNSVISFDSNLLKHVIDNLITNALKFATKNIQVSLFIDEYYARINIEDDGIGILKSEIETVFKPFATLNTEENPHKHIGLGLSIAKSIIELHNGSIAVSKSNQLGGAKFTIKLPK